MPRDAIGAPINITIC